MRVLFANHIHSSADRVCYNGRDVKRVLNEHYVTALMIAYSVPGRDTVLDLLHWAANRSRLPAQVDLVDSNTQQCRIMGEYLVKKGYRAFNDRQFIKH